MALKRRWCLTDLLLVLFMDLLILVIADLEIDENSRRLQQLSTRFWRWKLQQFPEYATTIGFHDYDHYLESYNLGRFEERKRHCDDFLRETRKVDRTRLSKDERLTLDVLQDQIQTYVDGYSWREYGNLNPINFLEGIHKTFGWVSQGKYETASHFRELLQRYQSIPTQISEIKMLMERAVRLNRTNHKVSMADVPGQIDELIRVPPEWTPYFRPFNRTLMHSPVSASDRSWLRRKAKEIIGNEVQPAFSGLKDFLLKVYFHATRKTHGVYSFRHGKEYYKACLQWHLSDTFDPETVHYLGLQEVKRIEGLMYKVMEQVNFKGTLLEFFRYLRRQKKFYFKTERQILEYYRSMIKKRIKPRLRKEFASISDIPPLNVRRMPYDGPSGSYWRQTLFINSRRPETRPRFDMVALALHEAYPGHHVQVNIIAPSNISESTDRRIPAFRRHIWGGKKYSAPFHFPYYTASVEGWGLYSEYLGEELGIYKDPYELFGRYSLEMFRACRLVIDTGIHVKEWTREKAIYYMANRTSIPLKQIEKEVDRYITWPGQACAYKIGEFRIKSLRHKAESELGSHFNVTEFHDQILRVGALPLKLLEGVVTSWINNYPHREPRPEYARSSHAQNSVMRTSIVCICIAVLSGFYSQI